MPKKLKDTKLVMPYVPESVKFQLSEQLKAQVDIPVKLSMPKDLGEEHPFDFKLVEDIWKRHGFVKAAVDKHLDFIFSQGFHIHSDDKKAETIISQFVKENNLSIILREWAQEAFIKGSGFLELAFDEQTKSVDMQVINANSVYVKRNKNGEIEGYNQYIGDFGTNMKTNMLTFSKDKIIDFKPDEIAQLCISKNANSAYGIGIVYPALAVLENLTKSEKDMHILIGRKANAPIIATLGSPEEPVSAADVAAFGAQLVYLNNLHEWAVSHHVKFEALDFGNLAEKFATVLDHDKDMLFYIFQVPAVIMGMANVSEGLGNAQLDTFERRIQSLQEYIEKVIQDQIFKPLLKMYGLASPVEIEWGQPSDESINNRLDRFAKILAVPTLSPQMKSLIEKEIAEIAGFDQSEIDALPDPEEAAQAERDKEEQMKEPRVPGELPTASEKLKENAAWNWVTNEGDLSVVEWANLQEIQGFNYDEYINAITDAINSDNFDNLRAKSQADLDNGLLDDSQVDKLKNVLINAFQNNLSITQIEQDIKDKVGLTDRTDGDTLLSSAEARANMIARTETVRLTNQGLLDMYKDNQIEKVRWLSSISDRTCDECLSLNGRVYDISEAPIPSVDTHPNCRCVLLSITE